MIRLKDASLAIGSFRLDNINLTVNKGQYFVIVGPTGSGKSSILNSIAGHYKIHSGQLWVDGHLANTLAVEERNIGYVFQAGLLFPHLSVRQNINFGLKVKKLVNENNTEPVEKIARVFHIDHLLDRSIHNLSGGEKQRVALARAMICRPRAMLLDEPFSSVDRNTAENLMMEFKKIQRETGQTVVHVTHNQEEAMMLADQICVVDKGNIAQVGKPEQILTRPESEFVADFFGAHNIFKGVAEIEGGQTRITLGGKTIYSEAKEAGDIVFSIRPEDIVITPPGNGESSPNTFTGIIRQMVDRGILYQVIVDIGFPIVSYAFRKTIARMGVSVADTVAVGFEPGCVHIIPRGGLGQMSR